MHKPATFSARSATLTALASRRSALTSSLDQRFLPQSAPKATGRNGLPSVTRSGQAGSPATALTTTREAAMLKSHRDQPKKK